MHHFSPHSHPTILSNKNMMKLTVAVALVASASAFVPAINTRMPTKLNFEYGEYDDKLWDNDAKKVVYEKWDPKSPRTSKNFNPFETFKGNSPDASGIYPGEPRYKDPIRPDVNFQQMMDERAEPEARAANPKPGDVPGAPGCKN